MILLLFLFLMGLSFSFFCVLEMTFAFSNRLRLELVKDEHPQNRSFSFFLNHSSQFSNVLSFAALVAFSLFISDALFIGQAISLYLSLGVWFQISTFLLAAFFVVLLFDGVLRLISRFDSTSVFMVCSPFVFIIYGVFFIPQWLYHHFWAIFSLDSKSSVFSLNRIVRRKDAKASAKPVEEFGNEVQLFQNVLDFSKIRLKDSMVPRTEVEAIDINSSLDDLRKLFISSHFSRILVYRDNIDHVLGYVHSADLFDNPSNIESILNPMIVVPELMTANKLLRLFLKQKKSIALVVDEFGGTSGLLTLEDVMEEIFGEIEDEHDAEDDDGFVSKKLSASEYVFSGRLEVESVNQDFNLQLPLSPDYVTISGLILDSLGFLPTSGSVFVVNGQFSFKILRSSSTRIDLVRLTILPVQPVTAKA